MLKALIVEKLNHLGIRWSQTGHEIQCSCLNEMHKDNTPSFSINVDSGMFNCFGCGFSGNFRRFLDREVDPELERNFKYLQALKELDATPSMPEHIKDVILPSKSLLGIPAEGIRGISYATLEVAGAYYCDVGKYRGRLIMPVKNTEGRVLGFDARIWQHPEGVITAPSIPNAKYLRPTSMKTRDVLYGIDIIQDIWGTVDTVVLTEGVIDALSWIELGVPAVANFGLVGASPNKAGLLLALGCQNLVNGFDLDPSGFAGWQKIKESWRPYLHISSPIPQITDMAASGMKDANDYLRYLQQDKEVNTELEEEIIWD